MTEKQTEDLYKAFWKLPHENVQKQLNRTRRNRAAEMLSDLVGLTGQVWSGRRGVRYNTAAQVDVAIEDSMNKLRQANSDYDGKVAAYNLMKMEQKSSGGDDTAVRQEQNIHDSLKSGELNWWNGLHNNR